MATININIGSNDIVNVSVIDANKIKHESKEKLYEKLYNDIKERCKEKKERFWYEVFIDFSEDFDDVIYPTIKDLPYDAALDLCWGYLVRRELYYSSPQWIEDLDKSLHDTTFK